jgi:hypothetical protein
MQMQLTRYQDEISAAIDALRRRIAESRNSDERSRAIREAKQAVKSIQKQAKRLIDERVTQQTSFNKMRRNRIIHGQQDLLLVDEMARSALAAIEKLGVASG